MLTWKDYCRDKLMGWATGGALAIIGSLLLLAFGCSPVLLGVLLFVLLARTVAVTALDYVHKRDYYEAFFSRLSALDRKYLIVELMEPAAFPEAALLEQAVRQLSSNMMGEIQTYKRRQEDYQEYIEMWVHEIKTPIASAKLLADNHPGPATAAMREEVDRVEDFVEQALYYARSAAVERDYLIREYALSDLVYPAVKKYARLCIEHRLSPRLGDLTPRVYTDGKWVQFILQQLLSNAIKYSPDGASIDIEAREEPYCVLLTLADHGVGIPAADLPRVFDKGFTGYNGRSHERSTGMGLYLCKKLCDKLGLGLSLSSQTGSGTAVRLTFPKGKLKSMLQRDEGGSV